MKKIAMVCCAVVACLSNNAWGSNPYAEVVGELSAVLRTRATQSSSSSSAHNDLSAATHSSSLMSSTQTTQEREEVSTSSSSSSSRPEDRTCGVPPDPHHFSREIIFPGGDLNQILLAIPRAFDPSKQINEVHVTFILAPVPFEKFEILADRYNHVNKLYVTFRFIRPPFKAFEMLADRIRHSSSVKKLYINGDMHFPIHDGEFRMLFNGIKRNESIEELYFNCSHFGEEEEAITELIKALRSKSNIKLYFRDLENAHLEQLAQAVTQNPLNVQVLSIDGFGLLKPSTAQQIVNALPKMHAQELCLNNFSASDKTIGGIFSIITKHNASNPKKQIHLHITNLYKVAEN